MSERGARRSGAGSYGYRGVGAAGGRGEQQQSQGAGGYSQDRRGGGGRGGGGRGGFQKRFGDPPPKVFFEDVSACPNPYEKKEVDPKIQKDFDRGWKVLPKNQEDVILHQKNSKDQAGWGCRKINVSVNHFLVESLHQPGSFPFPTLFHYDISYDIERKRGNKEQQAPLPLQQDLDHKESQQPGPSIPGKCGKIKRKLSEDELEVATKRMAASLISPPRRGLGGCQLTGDAGRPVGKRLPKHLTNVVMEYLVPTLCQKYQQFAIATDGSYNLYTAVELEKIGIPSTLRVTFEDLRNAGLIEDDDSGTIKVMLQPTIDRLTGEPHIISTESLKSWYKNHGGSLQGMIMSSELKQSLEAGCNAYVKSFPNFRYFAVGRNSMVKRENTETCLLGGGLVAWKGISANIAMGWKPYLNVDIANCAFILAKNVMDVLGDGVVKIPGSLAKWSNYEYDEARALLKTCKVDYRVGSQKRSGAIRDIPRKKTPRTHTFYWTEKQKNVSVVNYFKEKYNIVLAFPDGPLLEVRKNDNFVPAELCTIKKGQSYNRRLDGNQTTKMLDFARKEPDETKTAVDQRMAEMKLKDNKTLMGLGIKVADDMLMVNARVLVPPAIRYGSKAGQPNQIAHIKPTDGSWDCWKQNQEFNFYRAVTIKYWGILVVGCPKFQATGDQSLQNFAKCLRDNGKKKGIVFERAPNPIIVDKKNRRGLTPIQNSGDIENYFERDFKGCDIVVCVFPRKGDPLYGAIKHAAEVGAGILTQCVAERNVFDQRSNSCKDATIQNILFKMNTKLGGVNHVTVAPFEPNMARQFCTVLMDCPVMVLGADVTHAPPGSRKTLDNGHEWIMPSYAAVTGSLDRTCMPYMTEVRAQRKENREAAEVIQDLEVIVAKMIRCFEEKTGGLRPYKIIYFRDGVGSGQFREVLHVEMGAIRKACMAIDKGYQPQITFITVQKRHKTRFFWHQQGTDVVNAPAGTVIDQEIVHPTEIDFYLLSHKGLLGTSRPSRYHVLWDDSDLSQDQLQSLAYTLCYMYSRCTKSVKMPAPTYYAHLAAERAKKLCEGFETKYGAPSEENLNRMLERNGLTKYPMHFV